MTQKPSIGRIVHYQLSEENAAQINKRRKDAERDWREVPTGSQAHVGNDVRAGDTFPLIITRVFPIGSINGQVVLDGNDTLWALSVSEGEGKRGHWSWPSHN